MNDYFFFVLVIGYFVGMFLTWLAMRTTYKYGRKDSFTAVLLFWPIVMPLALFLGTIFWLIYVHFMLLHLLSIVKVTYTI